MPRESSISDVLWELYLDNVKAQVPLITIYKKLLVKKPRKSEVENVNVDNVGNREEAINKTQIPDVNAATYELECYPQNAMVIFNHENVDGGISRRTGTDRDVIALANTFKRFRFDVTTHNDLKRRPLLEELQRFGKRNFEDVGCICVAVLSHGSDHGYLRAADVRYCERDLFACFDTQTNPTLVAKPIIFLIQACRGDQLASSVPVEVQEYPSGSRRVELDTDRTQSGYFLPTEADMIIFHSCFFGRASARIVGEGTWFIQTLCEQLNLYASTEHLEDILRRVRKVVALEKGFEHAKQMPVMSTTLLRKLYLLPPENIVTLHCAISVNNANDMNPKTDTAHGRSREILDGFARHSFIGVAITTVYCCYLYSSLLKEHLYFFMCLVYAYMGHFGVTWPKKIATLVLLFIFMNMTFHDLHLLMIFVEKSLNYSLSTMESPTFLSAFILSSIFISFLVVKQTFLYIKHITKKLF